MQELIVGIFDSVENVYGPIAVSDIYYVRERVCGTAVSDYILLGVQWIICKFVCVLHTNLICLKTNHSRPRNNTSNCLILSLISVYFSVDFFCAYK